MSSAVLELYDALKKLGLDEQSARAAAQAVVGRHEEPQLATKADISDLRREMSDLKAELIKWNVGTLVALAALVSTIVTLLR